MSPFQKKQKDNRRKSFFRKWHRRIGFAAALFLLNLAITGIFLNHSEGLKLNEKFITSQWLIKWYGISAPTESQCLNTHDKNKPLCEIGNNLYFGENLIMKDVQKLIGLVEMDRLYYLATSQKIAIYTQQFELVELLSTENDLPTPIQKIIINSEFVDNLEKQKIVINVKNDSLKLNINEMTWQPTKQLSIMPIRMFNLKGPDLLKIQEQYLNQQITQLKLIQDLHSGRILLLPGKLLTDLVGVIIILLIISGFIAWQRRRKLN